MPPDRATQIAPNTEPPVPPRFTFPKQARILSRADFDRALRRGVRVGDGQVTIWVFGTEPCCTRLGLMIGRKHGNAVQRNRLKRLIREAFRLRRAEIPCGLDLVVSLRPRANLTRQAIEASLLALVRIAARRLRKATGATGLPSQSAGHPDESPMRPQPD